MLSRPDSANSSIRLPAVLAIGFTGHRKLEDERICRIQILDFLTARQASTRAILYGVSSVAAGGDLIFGESCLELGIPLRIFLPFPAEHFQKDFIDSDWERATAIMRSALSVEVIGDGQQPEERYYECGIQIVQQSHFMLALWDGLPSRGRGGTAEIKDFALAIGKPVVWLNSETGTQQALGQPVTATPPPDQELDFLNSLPDRSSPPRDQTPLALAQAWFNKLDRNAAWYAPRLRRLATVPIFCTAAAAVLTGMASAGAAGKVFLGTSTLLGIAAAVMPAALRLNYFQSRWARIRPAAELCRSVLGMWDSPAPYEAIGPEIVPELSGMLHTLQYLKLKAGTDNRATLADFRNRYRKERLDPQIEYFSRHARQAELQSRRFRIVAWLSVGAAILMAAWMFAGRPGIASVHAPRNPRWFSLALSALFQVSTITGALLIVKDCDRRRRRYRELTDVLRQWKLQFEAVCTWRSLMHVANRIERTLLVELLEWRSLLRHTRMPRR